VTDLRRRCLPRGVGDGGAGGRAAAAAGESRRRGVWRRDGAGAAVAVARGGVDGAATVAFAVAVAVVVGGSGRVDAAAVGSVAAVAGAASVLAAVRRGAAGGDSAARVSRVSVVRGARPPRDADDVESERRRCRVAVAAVQSAHTRTNSIRSPLAQAVFIYSTYTHNTPYPLPCSTAEGWWGEKERETETERNRFMCAVWR
jgi:hypothetical protein